MIWNYLLKLALVAIVSYALRPKVQTIKPASFEDLQLPTTELGRTIAKVWGRRWLKDPHLAWYGDLRTDAIKK